MSEKIDYPGFWQAVLLCLVFIGAQIAVALPVGVADVVLKKHFASDPLTLAFANTLAFAAVILASRQLGGPALSEVFALRRVPVSVVLGVVVVCAGAVVVLSEVDNLMRLHLPLGDWFSRLLRSMTSADRSRWSLVLLLVVVAPVTEEAMFRGLILRGF